MISRYIREQERYSKSNLNDILQCNDETLLKLIKRLKEYGVIKTVKNSNEQKNMSDLVDEHIHFMDEEDAESDHLYVFTFVGIIIIEGRVLKCYPKYLFSKTEPAEELKEIIEVLQKYNSKEQIIRMYHDGDRSRTLNLLAIMIYLINDYYENGIYTNTQDIFEINGTGEIYWEKTINESHAIICNQRPYYIELQTRKRVNNNYDYFKRLHECILSICCKELRDADLLNILNITEINTSDESIQDFGDDNYILYCIQNELNVQFNTRKQLVLKTIEAFILNKGSLSDIDNFSMFGTNCFNLVWEHICSEVMDNQLLTPLGALQLPVPLKSEYSHTNLLISLIDKPIWKGYQNNKTEFEKKSSETLIPDMISIYEDEGIYKFVIFDAKYYTMQLEYNKKLCGQPGVNEVTKQYLYQLAYSKFVNDHCIPTVKNCFLMPTEKDEMVEKGYVHMEMFDALDLERIQIRLLPARRIYSYYLTLQKLDIRLLNL